MIRMHATRFWLSCGVQKVSDQTPTTETLAQTIRLAYYTELCRKPPNSFVMRDWGLLVTIERAPWLAAARAAQAEFNDR